MLPIKPPVIIILAGPILGSEFRPTRNLHGRVVVRRPRYGRPARVEFARGGGGVGGGGAQPILLCSLCVLTNAHCLTLQMQTKIHLPPLSVTTQQARLFSMPHPERATLDLLLNSHQLFILNRLWFMPT